MTKVKTEVEGRLIGYLPFEGVCEIENDNGQVQCFEFSEKLTQRIRVHPDTLHYLLYKFLICKLSEHNNWVIDHFEVHPGRE